MQNLSIALTKFCAHAVYKARRKLYQACGLRQLRDFTSKAIELTIATHCVDFLRFCACKEFVTGLTIEKQTLKKIKNLHHTRGITPKHVTSGGVHLCACATQFRTLPSKNFATVASLPQG